MPPGEPVGSNPDPEKDPELQKPPKTPQKYESQFKKTDSFVEPLVNFDADTSNMDIVYSAVKYWADIAKDLRSKNYPIAEGIDNWKKFDQSTIQKARMLDDFLDIFITKRLYNDDKEYEVLRVLIAQGTPYLDFKDKMEKVDFSLKCNRIWENDAVAYRCNTCAFTPCMSLCETCFDANGHVGHDYTRFFSREGGACDCGNQDVIKEIGNCPNHGDESKRPKYDMSDVCIAQYIVTKLLVRLFLEYRGWTRRQQRAEESYHQQSNEPVIRRPLFDIGEFIERDSKQTKKVVEFLQECSNYGGPMRQIVSEILLSKELYKSLTEKTGEHYDESGRVELSLDWRTTHMFMDDRASVLPDKKHKFSFLESVESIECHTLLDELIFWIDRQLFPQYLVNFGLSLLSEPGYRDAFAFRFFAWYPICGKVISELCTSQSDHHRVEDRVSPACSRAVHVTVQMLSSAQLCKQLNEKVQLVKTIFDVTRYMICDRLVDSEMSLKHCNAFKEKPRFLNMATYDGRPNWSVMTMQKNTALNHHGYWFVMGDIQNVLTHTSLAVDSVFDDACFGGSYMRMMCQMQGMNPIWRIISGNAQENDTGEEVQSCRAYTLEFESLAVTLFNIVAAIQHEESLPAAKRFFDHIKRQLEEWFHVLLPTTDYDQRKEFWGQVLRAQAYAVSFHIPLHRHISTALTHFIELPGFYDYISENLLKDESFVRILLIHPLRIQVARSEIHCNMWVRNGATARMSAVIYCQWNVSSAFQTPDVDLIRFCAAHVDKDYFMEALTTSFNLTECIKVERGNYVESVQEARAIFQGTGDTDNNYVPENKQQVYNRYQHLIREHAVLIDRTILGYTDNLTDEDHELRQEIFQLMIKESLYTNISIDYEIENPIPPPSDPRIPIVGEFIRRHLIAGGVHPDEDIADREYDPSLFDDDDLERTVVIREAEWIDPMFWGMFKLIAELIVVRVNSGATSEEHYRSEMVNCMAMGNQPYSRLRASISEKGSRGSEMIDKHFERILKEIGDFNAPVEYSTHLQQGSYRLKTAIWDQEVCPVFFMMRSSSLKHAREVFAKMQEREKKNAVDKGQQPLEERFWVPFRLMNFDEKRRHQGIAKVYNLLLTERFLTHCVAVLASEHDTLVKFHDGTMQLAVYLLTLGVKYVQEFKGDKHIRDHMVDIYHTPFKLVKERELDFHLTITSFMIRLLTMECKRHEQLIPVFRKVLAGEYDCEKVSGGKMIYLARFMSILVSVSPAARELIEDKLRKEETRSNQLASQQQSAADRKSPLDPAKKAAKEAAKRRMQAIMQNSAKKSAQTMKKLMTTEGMSADEVNTVDPSQQNRKLYQCPICGELETPNTVENPFGMLAKLTTNFLCEEQIDASFDPIENLLEYDGHQNDEANIPQRETRRNYADKRRMAPVDAAQPELAKVRAPLVGTDPKSCGHTAHIECFNAYRASLYDGRDASKEHLRQVYCPMCRYDANIILPITLDKPYLPIVTPPSPLSFSDSWKVMDVVLKKAKSPVFEEDEKNMKYDATYSTRKGGGLYELQKGRKSSSDFTERQSSLETVTTSTYLISLAVAMVERASLLRRMGAPERRKNSRTSITEHLMTASVATSKDVDFDVTLSAMTNLFAKATEVVPLKSPSSSPRPSTSREPTPKPDEIVPGLTADEMGVMVVKSPPKTTTTDITEHRLKIALFVLEPKTTLVRMMAVLIDNQSVTKDVQREIAQNMVRASVGWVTSYTLFCLILRLQDANIRMLSDENLKFEGISDHLQAEAESIAKALTSNEEYFKTLMERLATPEKEPNAQEIVKTIERSLLDFLRFSAELLIHCDLGSQEVVNYVHDPQFCLEESLLIMGFDPSEITLPGKAHYYTLAFRNPLGWQITNNKFLQPCVTQPLAFKPRRILRPPHKFEELFSRYFHRMCDKCGKCPSMPIICLFCGELLCLDDCCNGQRPDPYSPGVRPASEIELHAESCSSSSGLFVSITSSMIIVLRGGRAALWGTVYLDAHKEEDRNLKRGKPLFLCSTRLKWLEFDWAEQEWQRVYNWYNLSHHTTSFINHIRECHTHH